MTDLAQTLAILEAAAARRRYRAMDFFKPRPKQLEFFAATANHSQVMFRAANQIIGKSAAGAFAVACHLTGQYPPWWNGRRFNHPVTAWLAGIKGTDVRDTLQTYLCGNPGVAEDFGTGFIPKDAFVGHPSMSRSATDMYDTMHVRHVTGGVSTARLKTYPEGRRGFQGKAVHVIQLDEEPGIGPGEEGIFNECKARTLTTKGLIMSTLTPLQGRTEMVNYFEQGGEGIALVTAGLNDADHLSEQEKQRILGLYRTSHDRDARLYGSPLMGSGRIFETEESMLSWDGEPRPEWAKLWGIDFGTDHPFAAALCAWDREEDCFYVLNAIRLRGVTKIHHIAAMRAIAANVPVAWPHDGHVRREAGGEQLQQLAEQYRKPGEGLPGLNMLRTHATFPDGSNSTEAGVEDMRLRMEMGRFRVRATLWDWFEEYRNYHRKDGQIVKINDDLLSATRVALMAKRFAKPIPLGAQIISPAIRRKQQVKEEAAVDPWTGKPIY